MHYDFTSYTTIAKYTTKNYKYTTFISGGGWLRVCGFRVEVRACIEKEIMDEL